MRAREDETGYDDDGLMGMSGCERVRRLFCFVVVDIVEWCVKVIRLGETGGWEALFCRY